jgi:P4 family phage/plasmid primase-like protien
MADGFSVVQWATDCSLDDAITKVCDYLGVTEDLSKQSRPGKKQKQNGNRSPVASRSSTPAKEEPKEIPLVFQPDRPKLLDAWLASKPSLTEEAFRRAGGRFAKHYSTTVIAFPVYGKGGSINGYAVYNATGGTIPYRPNKNEPIQRLKVKLVGCNRNSGWMGQFRPGQVTIKAEGVTDMLAILSCNPEASVITNPFGAGENPLGPHNRWMLEQLRGETVYTIHDADKAGQEGAEKWAIAISSVAAESRNAVLQFEDEGSKDVRDFLNERLKRGATPIEAFKRLFEIASQGEIIKPPEGFSFPIDESNDAEDLEQGIEREEVDSPHRLARLNLERYQEAFNRKLVYWSKGWLKYRDARWVMVDEDEIAVKLTGSIRREFEERYEQELEEWKKNGDDEAKPPKVRKVSRYVVSNTLHAMKDLCFLSSRLKMPCLISTGTTPNYLAFRNGILNLDQLNADFVAGRLDSDDAWLQTTSDWFSLSCLDYEFDPEAKCDRWQEHLSYVTDGDDSKVKILQEFAGYCLMSTLELQRWMILEGEGGNGKSVYIAGLRAMLGSHNVSDVTIDRFGDRFGLSPTIGKMLNISADLGEVDAVAEGVIKQFVSGDSVTIDLKNRDPISIRPTAKILAAWNQRPRIKDRSKGMWRRMIIVPFTKTIPDEKRVRGMDNPKFWEREAPGILNWAILGMIRLVEQGDFSKSDACEAAISDYKLESNPAAQFFELHVGINSLRSVRVSDLYEAYRKFCAKNGYSPLSSNNFGREVLRKFPDADRTRQRENESRVYSYRGIYILEDSDLLSDQSF